MHIEEQITISKKEYDRLLSLEVLVLQLEEEICLLKNGKKSSTSHTPPSHDIGRCNRKSLREKSGKKTGGQLGHETPVPAQSNSAALVHLQRTQRFQLPRSSLMIYQ